jgi:hypothetical protein
MTRQELPNLTRNFLDKGIPVPIGLIFDEDILNIGQSHQVVAYGYSMNGTTMTINIYDNRIHDTECVLRIPDISNPGEIGEFAIDPSTGEMLPLPNNNNDKWAGLLVEDGYRPQWPSYGPDISIASPQSLQLSGPVATAPVSVSAGSTTAKMASRPRPGAPGARPNQIVMVAQQEQAMGDLLVDTYSVQNYGEFPAHYSSLGIEIDAPDGSQSFAPPPAPPTDNELAPGDTIGVTINVASFGSAPGNYALIAGFNSVRINGPGAWFRILYPPASVSVAASNIIIQRPIAGRV